MQERPVPPPWHMPSGPSPSCAAVALRRPCPGAAPPAGQQVPAEAPLSPIVRSNKLIGMAEFVREFKEEDEIFIRMPLVR